MKKTLLLMTLLMIGSFCCAQHDNTTGQATQVGYDVGCDEDGVVFLQYSSFIGENCCFDLVDDKYVKREDCDGVQFPCEKICSQIFNKTRECKRLYTVGYDNGITPGSVSNSCGERANLIRFNQAFEVIYWEVNNQEVGQGQLIGTYASWSAQLNGWADFFDQFDPNLCAGAAFGFNPAPTWRYAEIKGCMPNASYGVLKLRRISDNCEFTIYPVLESDEIETYKTYSVYDCENDETKDYFEQIVKAADGTETTVLLEDIEDESCLVPCDYPFAPYIQDGAVSTCTSTFIDYACDLLPDNSQVQLAIVIDDCDGVRAVNYYLLSDYIGSTDPDIPSYTLQGELQNCNGDEFEFPDIELLCEVYDFEWREICVIEDGQECTALEKTTYCDSKEITTYYNNDKEQVKEIKQIDCNKCYQVAGCLDFRLAVVSVVALADGTELTVGGTGKQQDVIDAVTNTCGGSGYYALGLNQGGQSYLCNNVNVGEFVFTGLSCELASFTTQFATYDFQQFGDCSFSTNSAQASLIACPQPDVLDCGNKFFDRLPTQALGSSYTIETQGSCGSFTTSITFISEVDLETQTENWLQITLGGTWNADYNAFGSTIREGGISTVSSPCRIDNIIYTAGLNSVTYSVQNSCITARTDTIYAYATKEKNSDEILEILKSDKIECVIEGEACYDLRFSVNVNASEAATIRDLSGGAITSVAVGGFDDFLIAEGFVETTSGTFIKCVFEGDLFWLDTNGNTQPAITNYQVTGGKSFLSANSIRGWVDAINETEDETRMATQTKDKNSDAILEALQILNERKLIGVDRCCNYGLLSLPIWVRDYSDGTIEVVDISTNTIVVAPDLALLNCCNNGSTANISVTKEDYSPICYEAKGYNDAVEFQREVSVTNTGVGTFAVTFANAHPNGVDYTVTWGAEEDGNGDVPKQHIVRGTQTATGFTFRNTVDDNGTANDINNTNSGWHFQIPCQVEFVTDVQQN